MQQLLIVKNILIYVPPACDIHVTKTKNLFAHDFCHTSSYVTL